MWLQEEVTVVRVQPRTGAFCTDMVEQTWWNKLLLGAGGKSEQKQIHPLFKKSGSETKTAWGSGGGRGGGGIENSLF